MNDSVKPLRVLAIIPSGFCFGLQHVTVDFFAQFPKEVTSHFLLTRWTNGDLAKMLDNNRISYSYSWLGMFSRKLDWPNLKMSLHALVKLPRLYFDFWKLRKKFKPDVIYFANHHELILLYPALWLTRNRVVCHMHDPSPAIRFQQWTFGWYAKRVNRFIAISDNVRQRTIQLGCDAGRIETVHNGIEIPVNINTARSDRFCKAAGWDQSVFIIGITGQMTATKGAMDLLDAFALVFKQNASARLVIGGKQQEPFYTVLTAKIAEYGLGAYVYFAGWLPEVGTFFENIDVFVLASRHDEGYGLVVAQAMAFQKPVVITASGGAVEIVAEGEDGFIVPKEDVSQMANRLLHLSANPDLCKQMAMAGRKKVQENFEISKQARLLAACLSKVSV